MKIIIKYLFVFIFAMFSCENDDILYTEVDRFIHIGTNIIIDNRSNTGNNGYNLFEYDNFLKKISSSPNLVVVPLKDFSRTNHDDKVVLSLRYDIDWDINGAVRFAYREHKYDIRSSYFFLPTAPYYSKITNKDFFRNDHVLDYMKFMQNTYGHEIGFHNDLITMQLVYDISPREFLRNELDFLRKNDIDIQGTTYHGSKFSYYYGYSNAYFWRDYPDNYNYNLLHIGPKIFEIEKDSLKSYNLEYEGGLLKTDYFFSDVFFVNGKRWHMDMINLDTVKPGKKVIILLHAGFWN